MIAIPFIYFLIFLIYIVKTKGYDVSAYLTTLYLISSSFSLLITIIDLKPLSTVEIHFIPTLTYCFLLTLTIIPFYYFDSSKIKTIIPNSNRFLFNFISILFILIFVFLFITYIDDTILRLTFGNFSEQRGLKENIVEAKYSGLLKKINFIANIIANGSFLMILFFFYSLTILKQNKLYSVLILVSSLSILIHSIIEIDRSRMFLWLLVFGLIFILFKKQMNSGDKMYLKFIGIIISSSIVFYFTLVTISRFEQTHDRGAQGGFIEYAGQPFINYCNLFDKYEVPKVSVHRVFPITSQFILHEKLPYDNWNDYVNYKTNIAVNIFATSIGMFLIDIGFWAAFAFSIIYYIISGSLLQRKDKTVISLSDLIVFYILVIVPLFGIISYYYSTYPRNLCLLLFILFAILFKKKIVI